MPEIINNLSYVVLWLTSDCNLRCKYCYVRAGEKQTYMSFDTAKKVLGSISNPFKVQLSGGEPLLNFELVRQISSYINQHKIKASLHMQTNGTLITPEIAAELKEMNIAVGVSLDGPPDINDWLRGKTNDALRGIRVLAEYSIMLNITCVVTGQNISSLPRLVDMAFYLGNVRGIGLDLLRKTGRVNQNQEEISEAEPREIQVYLEKAYKRTRQIYKLTGKKIVIREIESARRRFIQPRDCKAYCLAALGRSAVFLPDGRIFPCGSLADREGYYIGTVGNPALEFKGINIKNQRSLECQRCRFNAFCPKGCPARAILNEPTHHFSCQDCAVRKTAFEIVEQEIQGIH